MPTIEIGYMFETTFGTTDIQGLTTFNLDDDESVEFQPSYIPLEVTGWYPVFTDVMSGGKRVLPKKKRGETAVISTNDPEQMTQATQPVRLKATSKDIGS